jgi:putative heme transporter
VAVVRVAVFFLALAAFALTLSSQRRASRMGAALAAAASLPRRLMGRRDRPSWAEGAVRFRAEVVAPLRRRWHWLTLATLVSHLSLFLVLVALRHVGVAESQVSWIEALAAFAFVRLLSAFPITPAGWVWSSWDWQPCSWSPAVTRRKSWRPCWCSGR